MGVFIGICLGVTIFAAYFVIVRPILKNAPIFSEIFKQEATLAQKISAYLVGWRTKIAARFFALAGVLLGLYDLAAPIIMGQDWSSLTAKLPAWTMPVMLAVVGIVFSWLRKITENPPVVVTQKDEETGKAMVVDVVKTP
jgi:hypothetical protein